MKFLGYRVKITPVCVANHGVENRVDYALSLLREKMIKSLTAYPKSNIELEYYINESQSKADNEYPSEQEEWTASNCFAASEGD